MVIVVAVLVVACFLSIRSLLSLADDPAAANSPGTTTVRVNGEAPAPGAGRVQEGAAISVPYRLTNGDEGGRVVCTLGPILDEATAVTAGHCGSKGDMVYLASPSDSAPIGEFVWAGPEADDVAVLRFYAGTAVTAISTVSDDALPAGIPVAKHGAATGRTAGPVISADRRQFSLTDHAGQTTGTGLGIAIAMCSSGGDSGAPVYREGTQSVVGIVLAGGSDKAGRCYSYAAPATALTAAAGAAA